MGHLTRDVEDAVAFAVIDLVLDVSAVVIADLMEIVVADVVLPAPGEPSGDCPPPSVAQ